MKKIRSIFNENQLFVLNNLGIDLIDDKDYCDDELIEIHDRTTDAYLSKAFDKSGEPNLSAPVFEQIIDIFFDKFDI